MYQKEKIYYDAVDIFGKKTNWVKIFYYFGSWVCCLLVFALANDST